eukprot:7562839-Ditylum_brightwellii.AAC.1
MSLFPLDVSNAFQTNIEPNPSMRVRISIPPFYLENFFTKWPDHPLKGTHADKLCIEALHSIQGFKDAGKKWYLLLKAICINELGMVMSTYDNAILSWTYKKCTALLATSTDDILMATSHRRLYDRLKQYFVGYSNYTTSEGNIICYLNTRIIVSPYDISLYITDHIRKFCKTIGDKPRHHINRVHFLSMTSLNLNSS